VESLAKGLEALESAKGSEERHAEALAPLVEAYLESGRPADARTVAASFLERRSGWTSNRKYTALGLRDTTVPLMLSAVRAGGGSDDEFVKARDAFAGDWGAHIASWQKGALWLSAFASYATSAADAQRALAALPSLGPLLPFRAASTWHAAEGNVYFLAGDATRALPMLQRGARACVALLRTAQRVHAELALGRARESVGDGKGACESYQRILTRWGAAKPRSVSAEEARRASTRLRCPR
jgi:serine/threonine-protein kinase